MELYRNSSTTSEVRKFVARFEPGETPEIVTHGLGTKDIIGVSVYRYSGGVESALISPDFSRVEVIDENTVRILTWAEAVVPEGESVKVIILG